MDAMPMKDPDAQADAGSNESDTGPEYDCTCPKCGANFTVEIEDGKAEPETGGGSDDSQGDNAAGDPDLTDVTSDGADSFRFARGR